MPWPAALPAEKRPACFSPLCPHHAGPCPLPAFSSCWFGEECTKATVVSTNTGTHCPQLPEGASWAEEQSQPSPKLQQAMSTGSMHLNSAWRPQGPRASRQAPKGSFFGLPSCHPNPSTSYISFHYPGSAAWLPFPPMKAPLLRPHPGLPPQELPKPASPVDRSPGHRQFLLMIPAFHTCSLDPHTLMERPQGARPCKAPGQRALADTSGMPRLLLQGSRASQGLGWSWWSGPTRQ